MTTWRPYRAATDNAELQARHEAACRKMGAVFPFPDLDDPRFLVVEVAERDGKLVGAVAAHATIELMFLGADPLVARAAVQKQRWLRQRLLAAGADEAHAFVPNPVLRRMEPILKRLGFRRSNSNYTVFYQEL